ncbi:ABC transporter B family member 20-like protein [Tanacetum coccineum]
MFDFGWTSPHGVGPLTPVSENPEALDSTDEPLPYFDTTTSRKNFVEENDEIEEELEVIAPSAVPFTALFRCADVFDWILIVVGSLCAVVHGGSLVAYLHLFGKIIHLLSFRIGSSNTHELFNDFSQFALYSVYFRLSVLLRHGLGSSSSPLSALSNIRTLYAFTNEALAKHLYASSLQDTLKYGILIALFMVLDAGFTYGISACCSCALQLWVGSGLNQATTNLYSFEQGRIAAYRLYEVIRHSGSAANSDGNILVSVQGKIEFHNVYFSYPSCPLTPILSGLYLTIPAKKTIALVGQSGSGKSSLIPLLERHYDPNMGKKIHCIKDLHSAVYIFINLQFFSMESGEVLLDGVNIKSLKIEWFRHQMGLVTQEPALVYLSIADNISYGCPNTTLDQIEEAAKLAQVHAFISSLENGYVHSGLHKILYDVGKSGLALTEEQKIRISIARAVLLNPSILLLDEVTNKLDLEA